jgi:chromosome segregation ATPase
MTDDKELIARLRAYREHDEGSGGMASFEVDECIEAADRIEALTEQLAAASQDTKALEDELEMQEQEACMMENDYIKLEKERDALEAKLAQVVEVMRKTLDAIEWYNQPDEDGLYWGGANADLIAQEIVSARATLAEIKGESQ